jgi:3-dehydro-L-gulonate 2-dehydrogenase
MTDQEKFIRVAPEIMKSEFTRILLKHGFTGERAGQCAEIFMVNSLEGVYSHGVNRFSRFVKNVVNGYIKPGNVPSLTHRTGSLEQWNGNLGPGPLNAAFSTDRAAELARDSGIGMVALANTNHWMRGGNYGWQAARKGFIFMGWTNTEANMPAWGAVDYRLGNNPFVIGLPFRDEAIVLDFAMTQFSYGKMEAYKLEGKNLPFPGGYDRNGNITHNPEEILITRRALPIGYWKGSGLSLLLDILATTLTGGLSTHEITKNKVEYSVSQVFIAISTDRLSNSSSMGNSVEKIIDDLKKSATEDEKENIRYPGENVVNTRTHNLLNGIPVNRSVWSEILAL